MGIRMKKKIICILLSATILTGCSNADTVLLPYTETTNIASYDAENSTKVSGFFAKDLTIIPDELNHMTNAEITVSVRFDSQYYKKRSRICE